jgi:hypothetical protein
MRDVTITEVNYIDTGKTGPVLFRFKKKNAKKR